jgi:hypothetical protein
VLGDTLFFNVMQTYASDTPLKYHSAVIQDFNNVVNQVTGQDYTWFFDEWIYQPNHPVYQNTYNFQDLGNNQWKVNFFIKQTQGNTVFFKMPVEVNVRFLDGTDSTLRFMNDVNYQQMSWIFGKQPTFFKFDPDRQIVLKGGSTVVGTPEGPEPGSFSLQTTPNPARETSTVTYSVGRATQVCLELTDLTGRVLMRPVNEIRPAGTHEVTLDCSGLPAGPYFYRLTAGENRLVRKLVIIK